MVIARQPCSTAVPTRQIDATFATHTTAQRGHEGFELILLVSARMIQKRQTEQV